VQQKADNDLWAVDRTHLHFKHMHFGSVCGCPPHRKQQRRICYSLQNGPLLSQVIVGMLGGKFFHVDSRQHLSRTYFPKSIIQERHTLNGITSQKFGAGTRRSLAIQVGDLDFLGYKIHSLSASRGCAPSTQPNPLFKPPVTMLLTTSLLRTLWSSEPG
jgi:hypothetical protein